MESESLSLFLAMGGYAVYVWSAFAATAIVLIVLLVASARALRNREAALSRLRAELRDGEGEPAGEA